MGMETFVSGVSAVLEAVQTWMSVRDRKLAQKRLDVEVERQYIDPEFRIEGETLEQIIPWDVYYGIERRARQCWDRYRNVLSDEQHFLPSEVDEATIAVQKCICRELRRIVQLNGSIPEGILAEWWRRYCEPNQGKADWF